MVEGPHRPRADVRGEVVRWDVGGPAAGAGVGGEQDARALRGLRPLGRELHQPAAGALSAEVRVDGEHGRGDRLGVLLLRELQAYGGHAPARRVAARPLLDPGGGGRDHQRSAEVGEAGGRQPGRVGPVDEGAQLEDVVDGGPVGGVEGGEGQVQRRTPMAWMSYRPKAGWT